ncbi:MAG: FadR family transcriptional regulator [Desulfosarcina sp.]|nr:FadR family transcriptional regulator [Desulfobacterales bacterium]
MFKKTTRNRVFQDLVDQIQSAILDGRLQPGDKLPPQRTLMEMFQTSRASIREALRVLEQKGLIEIKLGVQGGAVITTTNTDPITEMLTLLVHQKQVSLDHLEEFRLCVEGDVTALAAQSAQPDDIKKLRSMLAEARNCLGKGNPDSRAFIRVDIRLHVALAEITGNPVFMAVVKMVHETILGYYDRFTFQRMDVLEENYQDLCSIVDAVESGASEEARRLARQHIRRFNRHMKEKVLDPT